MGAWGGRAGARWRRAGGVGLRGLLEGASKATCHRRATAQQGDCQVTYTRARLLGSIRRERRFRVEGRLGVRINRSSAQVWGSSQPAPVQRELSKRPRPRNPKSLAP